MRIIKYRKLKSKPISEKRYRALLARTEVKKAYELRDGQWRIDVSSVCEKSLSCPRCALDELCQVFHQQQKPIGMFCGFTTITWYHRKDNQARSLLRRVRRVLLRAKKVKK